MDNLNLTLRQALALDSLEDFIRQEETRGVELMRGSDFERALALLITQRQKRSARSGQIGSSDGRSVNHRSGTSAACWRRTALSRPRS